MTATHEQVPVERDEKPASNAEGPAPPPEAQVDGGGGEPPPPSRAEPAPSPARALSDRSLLEDIKRQIELQPAQLRKLQRRLEEVGLGLGEQRFKALLERLISYLDLVERAQRELVDLAASEGIAQRLLAALHGELLHILELNEVRPSEDHENELFEPQKHECVETVSTPSSDRDGYVARIERPGYNFGERRLRHSRVAVYKYVAEATLAIPDAAVEGAPS